MRDDAKQKTETFELVPGRQFEYEPVLRRVVYDRRRLATADGRSALLHELAHALLRHRRMRLPARQERVEAEAWALAAALAEKLGLQDVQEVISTRFTA